MKTLSIVAAILSMAVFFAAQASQADTVKKIVCRASGAVQTIQSVIVERTDLEGQICAISSDRSGALSFYVSNGSLEDEKILVAHRSVVMDGDYSVYLQRSLDKDGKPAFALDQYFVCDENDIEFCHGSNRKTAVKNRTDSQLQCRVVTE